MNIQRLVDRTFNPDRSTEVTRDFISDPMGTDVRSTSLRPDRSTEVTRDFIADPMGTSSFGITQSIRLDPVNTSTPGTYMITLVPADPHGDPLPDLSQCSITITIDNDYTADITTLPPPPPQVPAMRPDVRQAVPDSVILALHGTLSNPDTSGNTGPNSPQSPPPPQAPPAFTCGYATASVIGVLGSSYPYSFIVRTYSGGGESCNDQPLTFFFKVCHR